MATQAKWETRPLQCWNKVKEMRLSYYRGVATARDEGKILVTGSSETPYALLHGLGDDVVFFGGEPYAASVGADLTYSLPALAAAETNGLARDMCSYMRNYLGSMYSDHYMFTGGPFPKPSFVFTMNMCDAGHAKWYQVVADYHGLPMLTCDYPIIPDGVARKHKAEFVARQLADCIDQMERITGRTYDDEKFIEASRILWECETIWSEICLLNGAVPAPLDLKTMLGILPANLLFHTKREGLETLREIRDEVKDRIANNIAAVANERTRLMVDYQPVWSHLRILREFQDRGVVFVGIWNYLLNGGSAYFNDDGSVTKAKTPQEMGWPLKTREDCVLAWGRHMMDHHTLLPALSDATVRTQQLIKLFRAWNCHGLVMQYNRGCPLAMSFQPEVKAMLESAGIPLNVTEGNFSDVRDSDIPQTLKRWDAFIDLLQFKAA